MSDDELEREAHESEQHSLSDAEHEDEAEVASGSLLGHDEGLMTWLSVDGMCDGVTYSCSASCLWRSTDEACLDREMSWNRGVEVVTDRCRAICKL